MAPTWGHLITVERMRTSASLVVQDLQSCAHFNQQRTLEVSVDGCDPAALNDNPKSCLKRKLSLARKQ
jgi:hypothetical protein